LVASGSVPFALQLAEAQQKYTIVCHDWVVTPAPEWMPIPSATASAMW